MYDANEAERLSGGTEPRVWIRMAAAMLLNLLAAPPTTALDLEPRTTSASVELAERAEALAATMLDQLDGFAVDLDQFDTSRSWQHLHEANKAETYTVATRPNRARRRSAMMLIVGVSVRRGNAVLDDEDDDGDELIGS